MVELRRIKMFLLMILLLHSTAVTGQHFSSIAVRAGDDATLPCEDVRDDQDQCDKTNWSFTSTDTVVLVTHGKITEEPDRLSVTEKCSLVIKNVSIENVGVYTCIQFDEVGQQEGPGSDVDLFVVTMTEQQLGDKMTLSCFLRVYMYCEHTVKWVFEGKDVDEGNTDMKTSQSDCSVTVTFPTSYLKHKPNNHQFQCKVTDRYISEVQLFNFSVSSSDASMIRTITSEAQNSWWSISFFSVVLATLIIIVVIISIWIRTVKRHDDEDGDDATVNYENVGEPSVSVRLH